MSLAYPQSDLVVESLPRDKALQAPRDLDSRQMFDFLHVSVDLGTFSDFSLVSIHGPEGEIVEDVIYGKWDPDREEIELARHPVDDDVVEYDPYPMGPTRGISYAFLYKDPWIGDPDEADFPEYPIEPIVPDSPDDFEEDYYEPPEAEDPEPPIQRPWIDVPFSALSSDPGLHVYEVLWRNDVTRDLKYQAFCYRVLEPDPDKPYIYMRKQESK